jgi:hypothetical protein
VVSEEDREIILRFRLLCEASIDVVVYLCNFVRWMDGDGWAFAPLDTCKTRHRVVCLLWLRVWKQDTSLAQDMWWHAPRWSCAQPATPNRVRAAGSIASLVTRHPSI